ncbi:uncharacterized protein CCOS01_01716 [Colletotrichum costaricense]|uniref:Uncharacterized protein n=1 Tax=Colletotrichum costaricense TaxID=1209916 RepID=A0AAJ0E6D9_9PEZI|nr:uncharacterized protein CCOS01_01716 [Colletotrichum costaricense]KAK1536396.1 hypothetical protein CCOS01_01716 [Colletotrichum costaricense]
MDGEEGDRARIGDSQPRRRGTGARAEMSVWRESGQVEAPASKVQGRKTAAAELREAAPWVLGLWEEPLTVFGVRRGLGALLVLWWSIPGIEMQPAGREGNTDEWDRVTVFVYEYSCGS